MLQQKLSDNLKESLKSGKQFRVDVLRMILSNVHNRQIEKGRDEILTDDEIFEVLSKEAKKRKEAAEIFKKGNRNDLAEKEEKEFAIIKEYLPEQLSEAEIDKIVMGALKITGVKEMKDFGRVMAEAMKSLRGRADASSVSSVIKKKLNS